MTKLQLKCSDNSLKDCYTDLAKGEKLDETNYDICHGKVQYLINEVKVLQNIITPWSNLKKETLHSIT